MSDRPPSLGLVADRRIREAAAQAPPRLDVRGPVAKTMGKVGASARAPQRPAGAGLTRRERRVKEILLKELETMNGRDFGAGLSYNEIQKLKKTLDVAFIDAELAKMERQLRWVPKLILGGAAVGAVVFVAILADGLRAGSIAWGDALVTLFPLIAGLVSPFVQSRAIKRKIWIYQALRELSDAEDEGVQLDESVRLADLLIDRIVAAEDAAASAPLHRIRT